MKNVSCFQRQNWICFKFNLQPHLILSRRTFVRVRCTWKTQICQNWMHLMLVLVKVSLFPSPSDTFHFCRYFFHPPLYPFFPIPPYIFILCTINRLLFTFSLQSKKLLYRNTETLKVKIAIVTAFPILAFFKKRKKKK